MSLSKYSKKVWIPDVGSKPHQPLVNFKFPYREFGKRKLVKRAFQHSWFAKWKWLHYEEDMDKAFCYNCIQEYKEDKLRASNLELAFISKGFNNWKDASVIRYSNLEQLLLKAVCKENYSSEFDFVTKFYGPDLNVHALEMQLQIFATNFIMEGKKTSIKDILKYLRNISSAQRALLSEICIIAKLILVMPATNAVSERSFSALRRVKTYLRSTMKQTRLNHLTILHVHKDITDSLNLNDIGNEFVRCSEHRLSVFGHF